MKLSLPDFQLEMKKIFWPIVLLLFSIIVVFLLRSNLPLTSQEVREGYTAYSLVKTGKDTNGIRLPLQFKADGNYLSTFGTYIKVPFVKFMGLTDLGVRLPSFLAGLFCIPAFYFAFNKLFKDKFSVYISLILLIISPVFIESVLFNSGLVISLAIVLLFIGVFVRLNKKNKGLFWKIFAGLVVLFSIYIFKFQPDYIKFIKRESVISDLIPSAYSYEIDLRLSYGQIYNSPLVTSHFNFTRIALNKYFFGINALFKSFIYPFDFERLFAPTQSQTIISKDGGIAKLFPSFYFWELPLIIAGFLLFYKKEKNLLWLFALGFVPYFFFKNDYVIFLLPFTAVCESFCLSYMIDKFKKQKNIIFVGFGLVLLLSLLTYLDLMKNHFEDWFNSNDLIQQKIWTSISSSDLSSNKIVVTDRWGEPVFYYLFYEKIDPNYYLMSKKNGPLIDGEIQRIDSVGNVFFRSFNYQNETKMKNEIWVGSGLDFGEKTDELKIIKI